LKQAWLQEPKKLPYIGEGKNLVPCIHVKDLARIVKKVYESKPEDQQYIVAIDNMKRPTQRKIVQVISEGIGTGLIEQNPIPPVFKKNNPKKTPL
jgi:adenylate kinase